MIGRWVRQRGFGRAPYGRAKWWLAPVRHEGTIKGDIPVTAAGQEIVEVIEVVNTGTLGEIVFYRQWIEDPDGVEVDLEWSPHRDVLEYKTVANLRAAVRTMAMTPPVPTIESLPVTRGVDVPVDAVRH
jgi:hypothetical protein